MRFALVLSLLIAIVAVVFASQNNEMVNVTFQPLGSTVDLPLSLVIIACLLIGLLVGVLGSLPARVKSYSRVRKLEKRVAELEGGAAVAPSVHADARAARVAAAEAEGAAETSRLAAETSRMAARSQRPPTDPPPTP